MLVGEIKLGRHKVKTPAICGSVKASSPRAMMREVRKAFRDGADVVELRIDSLRTTSGWEKLLKINGPIILTNRSKREGGDFTGGEEERVGLLLNGIQRSVPCIDLEFSTPEKLRSLVLSAAKRTGVTVLLSYHNFSSTPSFTHLVKVAQGMEKTGCDMLKLVTFAKKRADAFRVLEFVARAQAGFKVPLTAFAMGKSGTITRFVGAILRAPLVYAAVSARTAPGQLDVKTTKALLTGLVEEVGG
jgi:3-dehydroquinate dehydratase type I